MQQDWNREKNKRIRWMFEQIQKHDAEQQNSRLSCFTYKKKYILEVYNDSLSINVQRLENVRVSSCQNHSITHGSFQDQNIVVLKRNNFSHHLQFALQQLISNKKTETKWLCLTTSRTNSKAQLLSQHGWEILVEMEMCTSTTPGQLADSVCCWRSQDTIETLLNGPCGEIIL